MLWTGVTAAWVAVAVVGWKEPIGSFPLAIMALLTTFLVCNSQRKKEKGG